MFLFYHEYKQKYVCIMLRYTLTSLPFFCVFHSKLQRLLLLLFILLLLNTVAENTQYINVEYLKYCMEWKYLPNKTKVYKIPNKLISKEKIQSWIYFMLIDWGRKNWKIKWKKETGKKWIKNSVVAFFVTNTSLAFIL